MGWNSDDILLIDASRRPNQGSSLKSFRKLHIGLAVLMLFAASLPLVGIASAQRDPRVPQPIRNARLNIEPETDTNPSGTSHTVTAFVTDVRNGQPFTQESVEIDVEYTGANDPDGTESPSSPDDGCNTGTTGQCTFVLGDTEPTLGSGLTTIRAWINFNPGVGVQPDHSEGRDESTAPGQDSEPDQTDVVEKTWGPVTPPPSRLNVEPETDTNPTNTDHIFTATVTDPSGNPVSGSMVDFEYSGTNDPDSADSQTSPDDTCTTGSGGTCTVALGDTETTTSDGLTTGTAWVDVDNNNATSEADAEALGDPEDDDTDVVQKTWGAAVGTVLNVEPESDSNAVNSDHVFTATVTDGGGNPVSGTNVDFEYTGTNDPDSANSQTSPDDTCTTGAGGTCTVTLGDTESTASDGSTTGTAWIDSDNSNGTSEANSEPHGDPEDDDTDVVTKSWTSAVPAVVDVFPETDDNAVDSDHTFTATVTDSFGNPVNGASVDFEYTGANDPDSGDSKTSPDDSCTTNASGVCTVTLGDGESTSSGGTTVATAWIDADGSNGTAEANNEPLNDPEDDDTDVVEKAWGAGQPTVLDVSPETDSNPMGTDHTFTATVTDAFGNVPSSTVTVDFEYEGANDPDNNANQATPEDTCTAGPGNGGVCSVTLGDADVLGASEPTDESGTTTATAWIDSDTSNATSEANSEPQNDPEDDDTDVVTKSWSAGAAENLDVGPETASNTTGSDHTFTATVTDDFGNPVSGAVVDFEYTGANDPDGNSTQTSVEDSCTTGSNGQCSVTLGDSDGLGQTETTNETGTTTATAWIDADNSDATSEADSEPLNDPEDDDTDVVTKTWTTAQAPPEPLTIPEGATHSGFTTFVLISNPSGTDATDVDVTFLTPSGPITPTATQNLTVPANSRRTIDVNLACACSADVATKVDSPSVQVHAEAAVHKSGSLAEMIMSGTRDQADWLMAEGATHSGFTTFITIANPNSTDSVVDVTFIRPGGVSTTEENLTVPAGSRRTLSANAELGTPTDVSTKVHVESGAEVVAGRSIHKVDDGGDLAIGGSVGVLGPATTHVVPEGATHSDWHTFVLVFSQGPSVIDISFLTSSGVVQGDQNVAINGRYNIDVNPELGIADDVATLVTVESGAPVAVEGTIQKDIPDGFVIADSHSSFGGNAAATTAPNWLVSEGATHSGFFTFILVSNPNNTPAVVDVDYLTKGSGLVAGPQDVTIPALGRRTFLVNLTVAGDDVSTLVTSDSGTVVVEISIDRIFGGFSKGRTLGLEL